MFTDGDLRRALDRAADLHGTRMDEVMTRHAKTVQADMLAAEAVLLMETHRITSLVVVDPRQRSGGCAQCARSAARRCRLNARKASAARQDRTAGARRRRRAHRRPSVFLGARRSAQGVPRPRRPRHQALDGSGVAVAALSGRRSAAVTARMRELEVRHVVQGCADKVAALRQLARRLGIDPLACACLVDDTPDLPLMAAVGFAAAVADAHPLVRSAAHWVSEARGGRGAVRELCEPAACPQPRPKAIMCSAYSH